MYQFFSNNLNPILVKEIRQFVRNSFIVVLTNLYICLLVFIFILALLFDNNFDKGKSAESLLTTFGYVVIFTGFLAVAVRTVWSTSLDRINEDLMFYSSITPLTIVMGKIYSGVVITLLLLSITFPFMTLVYVMGGVDLGFIFLLFVGLFVIIQVLNALSILVAVTSKLRFAPVLSLGVILIIFFVLNMLSVAVMREWSSMACSDMLVEFCGLIAMCVALFALIVSVAVAKLSPSNSNRLFMTRFIVTIIYVAGIYLTLTEVFLKPLDEVLPYAVVLCFCVLMLFLLFVVCESDTWSFRIRRNLPQSVVFRIILFPFYTGAACGLIWVGLMMLGLVWIDLFVAINLRGVGNNISFFYCNNMYECRRIVLAGILFFNFCITAMLIRSWFWRKLLPVRVWLLAFFLVICVSFISMAIYFIRCVVQEFLAGVDAPFTFTNNVNWFIEYRMHWLSGIDLIHFILYSSGDFFRDELIYSYCGIFVWAIILLFCLIIWYGQRLKYFSPHKFDIDETIS
ncbi:MAG: hypothetical protein LBP59_12495 [Planctomycetaceae bacterium]|jgi:hypothetical protein|nr:hypothetical protein [Planctomycetaceae bacterium]